MDAKRLIKGAAVGAVAGLAASWVMSHFHGVCKAAWSRDRAADEPNTIKVADAVAEATIGEPVPEEYREPTGIAVHYGFGALLGAAYGAAVEVYPSLKAGFGTGYGAATSLIADELAMPLLGFTPPATEVSAEAHIRGFLSHLVFGAALEGARKLLLSAARGEHALAQTRMVSTQSA